MHTAAILEEASELLTRLESRGEGTESLQGPGEQVAAGDGEEHQLQQAAQALKGARPSLVFCGDLNSDLNDGIPGMHDLTFTDGGMRSCIPFILTTHCNPAYVAALPGQVWLSCCRQAS